MTERVERIVAWAVALVAHLLIGIYLLTAVGPNGMAVSTPDEAVQVVFIQKTRQRAEPAKVTPRSARADTPRSNTVPTSARRLPLSPAVASPETLQVVTSPESSPPKDDWGVARAASRPAPPRMDFKHNPLTRRPPAITSTVDRMHLKMRDRSLGGFLQAMTKSSICGELRRALKSSPSSAASILASMEQHDCSGI